MDTRLVSTAKRLERPATPEDYALFARFFPELGAEDPTPRTEWWNKLCGEAIFLEEDGVAVGYAWAFALGEDGYVNHVVIDAAARGRGVGRALMEAVARRLRAAGCVRWSLFVKEDNATAIALYRRCGLAVKFESEMILLAWDAVASLPYDASVTVRPLDVAEDGETERAFGLPVGRFERSRCMPGRRSFAVAHCDETIVGVLVFDVATTSTQMLHARTPAVARALLEAVRPARRRSDTSDTDVRLFIDADPILWTAAKAAGGRLMLRMLRMEGSLSAV
jgi:ribosomal protein S18 acetylase RimI-like enzyme